MRSTILRRSELGVSPLGDGYWNFDLDASSRVAHLMQFVSIIVDLGT
jgi:hypothetical protein